MKYLKLLAFTFLLSGTSLAAASSLPDFPFIGVTGEAEIDVAPDTVEISFGLIEFSDALEKALLTIKQQSQAIIDLIHEFEIPNDAFSSTGIDKQTKRHSSRETGYTKTDILGYEIFQGFKITLNDLSKYSPFTDRLISLLNTANILPKFDVKNRKGIEHSLIKKAVENAKQKANGLADAHEVSIQSVYAMNEGDSFDYFFAQFGLQEKVSDGSIVVTAQMRASKSGYLNMLIPKSMKLKKTVSIVYKIKP